MMNTLPNLRQRIIWGLILYTFILTLAVGLHGFIINNHIEKLVLENILNIDERNFNPQFIHQNTPENNLHLYDAAQGDIIPEVFKHYPIGIHDDVYYNDRHYVIRVLQQQPQLKILSIDITNIEHQELRTIFFILILTVLAMTSMAWIGYQQLGKLIDPLLLLADDLSRLAPIKGHLDIDTKHMPYYESYILTDAIQSYIEKSNRFLESEKEFLSTTSHELRTPIAVLSGAVEVLLQHPAMQPALIPHVQRIAHVAEDMQELVNCLLFLARDNQRLKEHYQKIDLSKKIIKIIEHHAMLYQSKNLEILNLLQTPFYITAPPKLINIVMSNLLRNAIEHSHQGYIKIMQQQHALIIEDSGHGMSMQELSTLYTQQVRIGLPQSGGIGIPLILKICEHLGWKLDIQSKSDQGTTVILNFQP